MEGIQQATPAAFRARIDAITKTVEFPHPTKENPDYTRRVDGELLKTLDMTLLVGGFRINEVVIRHSPEEANTSDLLSLSVETHYDTGEEALVFRCGTLKKKVPTEREFAVPLKPEYEPYAKKILDAFADGNPFNLDRHTAYRANRVVFAGLVYDIEQQILYKHDDEGKLLRDEKNKPIVERVIDPHPKPASDHVLRHTRNEELDNLQLTEMEITAYFRWSPITMGINPQRMRYRVLKWPRYFGKFLRRH